MSLVTPSIPFFRPWRWLPLALAVLAAATLSAQNTGAPGGRGAPETPETIAQGEETVNTLIMVDQPLDAVLKYLEQLTGKAILRSQSLPALKINFNSLAPMTKDEAIRAIESVLALNGILITPVGEDFLKVVAAAGPGGAMGQVPRFLHGSALELPPSQAYFTKYIRFNYLDASTEGKALVQKLASAGTDPVEFPKNNALLITDMLVNLQRIEQVLETADVPDYQMENVFFFTLRHIKASDLVARLQKLTEGNSGLARYFANNTTFEADERTNQLIVITHPSNKLILENLVSELDKDVEPITTSEVIYIKHAQAKDIDTLLEEVISGQQSAREKSESAQKSTASPESNTAPGSGGRDSLAADQAPLPAPTEGVSGVLADLDTRNFQFSDFITIVADERSNAIVVYGTKSDLAQIKRLVEQIDVLLAQVYIEVLIAEVTLTDEEVSGISELGISGNELAITDGLTFPSPFDSVPLPAVTQYGLTGSVTGVAGSTLIDNPPFDFNFSLRPDEFDLVLRTAAENQNVRILSVPNIVTTHNQEANVNVSQSQPIITSTVSNLNSNNTDGTTSNDVQYRDIGIQLKVKPLIGSDGTIQMEIEQIVENVVSNTEINGTLQPIIGKREATSFVSISNGDVIVLAGLQETQFSANEGKIWLLGDIPLLGDLINPEGESNNRRELMIFIRPTVYFNPEDAHRHAMERMGTIDNGGDIHKYLETNNMSDVTRDDRDEAIEQQQTFETESRGDNDFEVLEYNPKQRSELKGVPSALPSPEAPATPDAENVIKQPGQD